MTRRIRVLQLIDSLSVGGAERLLINLTNHLDPQQFECYVCCLGTIRGNALQSEFSHLQEPPYAINAKGFYNPRSVAAVANYVRAKGIDIIHTHLTYADVLGRIVGRIVGRPVVSTLHNQPYEYNRQRIDRRTMQRLTARYLATHLVAVAQGIRQMYIDEWHIPANRITGIYNAVPLDDFLAIPEGDGVFPDKDGPVITNIGRLTRQKAQANLLQAAKLVLAQHPNARFMIVGQGHLQQQLSDQAQQLGIADRVTFTGMRRDIPAVLAQTDIFALPSLWEGLPLTAVEAMAAARPMVISDVGGNAELVQNGVQGFVIPPNDVDALATALIAMLNDPERRRAMGHAARERVRHDFSMSAFAAQHAALYQSLYAARQTGTRNIGVSARP